MNRLIKLINYRACWFILLACSCINQLETEQDKETSDKTGSIPISMEDKALQQAVYKTIENPQTGLFVFTEKQEISEAEDIRNLPCRIEKKGIIPAKEIFYPDNKDDCTFVSYFPYKESGIISGSNSIPVDTKLDQRSETAFLESDFMVAYQTHITASKSKVKLEHLHKCSIISFSLETDSHEETKKLLKHNPTIGIRNLKTDGTYDFETDSFVLKEDVNNLSPYGKWYQSGKKLTGIKVIVPPQDLSSGTELATITIEGRSFTCRLPEKLELLPGKDHRIAVQYIPDTGINHITAEILDWEEGTNTEVDLDEIIKTECIQTNTLNFDAYPIYAVFHQGKQLMTICQEYLQTDSFSCQAIVAYPQQEQNDKMSNGIVLELKNRQQPIHGGTVIWNEYENTCTYKSGNLYPINKFYIDCLNQLSIERPEYPLQVYLLPVQLVDQRNDEKLIYSLVKIGTQIWMKENLATHFYNDHKKITHKTENSYNKTNAGYFSQGNKIFYNRSAVATFKLAPQGFRIPTETDWEKLKKYLHNDTSVLKADKKWNNANYPANGLTGFNALPIGIFTKAIKYERSIFDFQGIYLGLWTTNNEGTEIAAKARLISNKSSELLNGIYTDFSGYSIRCIKQ